MGAFPFPLAGELLWKMTGRRRERESVCESVYADGPLKTRLARAFPGANPLEQQEMKKPFLGLSRS